MGRLVVALVLLHAITFALSLTLPPSGERKAGLFAVDLDYTSTFFASTKENLPLPVRYFDSLMRFLSLDWGDTWAAGADTWDRLLGDWWTSAKRLVLIWPVALIIALTIGVFTWHVRISHSTQRVTRAVVAAMADVPAFGIYIGGSALLASGVIPSDPSWKSDLLLVSVTLPLAASLVSSLWATQADLLERPFVQASRASGMSEQRLRFLLWRNIANRLHPPLPARIGVSFSVLMLPEGLAAVGGLGHSLVEGLMGTDLPLLLGISWFVVVSHSAGAMLSAVTLSRQIPE